MDQDRPLFRGHPTQSMIAAGAAALVAYGMTKFVPTNAHTYSLLQTAIAFLALASMAVFVVMHHRGQGNVLSQTQEEVILIAAFGLFCFALVLARRAYSEQDVDIRTAGFTSGKEGLTGGKRPFPCSNDATACIVEEWSWF